MKCVFCEKIANEKLETVNDCVIFEPLNPVTPGHLLIVPKTHIKDFTEDSIIASEVMNVVAMVANRKGYKDCNVITSKGTNATQTVFHMHVHLIPRLKGDGLILPWTNQSLDKTLN